MSKEDPERLAECERIRARLAEELPDTVRRSEESRRDLERILVGAAVEPGELSFDLDGLRRVEKLLHLVARGDIEADRAEFVRITGYFLAQCFVEQAGGRWDIHDVCTKRWRPYLALHVGSYKVVPFPYVTAMYAKGAGPRPKHQLSKLLRELCSEADGESA